MPTTRRLAPPPRHVVAIDDSPDVLALYVELLADAGYRVSCLPLQGTDLDEVKRLSPDLVLLDYGPEEGGHGWQLLLHLKENPNGAALPVIVCSGAAAARLARRSVGPLVGLGVGVVAKPFDTDQLEAEVRRRIGDADRPGRPPPDRRWLRTDVADPGARDPVRAGRLPATGEARRRGRRRKESWMDENDARGTLTPSVGDRDHRRGPATAPVTLVEFGDYECPACGGAYPAVEEIRRIYGDRLRFVFRNYPLTEVHPHAERAAEAAEAAGAQGRFWEMHDRLYRHQDRLADGDLLGHAAAVGLDGDRFARDLADGAFAPRVRDDLESGDRSGVAGTPTFFVNGVRWDGAWDAASLRDAIDAAARRERAGGDGR